VAEKISRHFVWFLLALAGFAVFFELGRMDIVDDNEGQRATPPREMLRTGNFVIPTINEKDYLSKPPLLYWAIAGLYTITGTVTPFTARIPTALCFIALIMCTYFCVRREVGEETARWSAVAMLVTPYALQRARYAGLDIPLTLTTFLAIMAFWGVCRSESARRTAVLTTLGGIALGAAALLKGPVPFIFLAIAWLAQTAATSPDLGLWLKRALKWTAACFVLETVLKLLVLVVPSLMAHVRFPVALSLATLVWIVLAWRHGDERRTRYLMALIAIGVLGALIAAPWGVAVIMKKGWPFVVALIHSESLDRTHTATAINSGHPFYYLFGLPAMLAPWGFLLPCLFSKQLWQRGTPLYRFSLFVGGLTLVIFSLIAGKEYEYILPGAIFLIIASGFLLAERSQSWLESWVRTWVRKWQEIMLALLTIGAVGMLIYIVIVQHFPVLIAEAAIFAAVAVGVAYYGKKHPARRTPCLVVVALCAILAGLLSQAFHKTGKNSYKTIATLTGDLVRAGYDVEAVKMTSAFDVYPGFAFYANVRVPTLIDPETSRKKLEGNEPYFGVLRERILEEASPPLPEKLTKPLLGPYTKKDIIIIGNRPLPKRDSAPH